MLGFNSTSATAATENNTQDAFTSKLIRFSHPTAPLAQFNQKMANALRARREPNRVLKEVLQTVAEIKKQNLKFDADTYLAMLTAYARTRNSGQIFNILDQMAADGFEPTVEAYNIVLEVDTCSAGYIAY